MKDLKTLIAEYNAKHNADVTHVLKGEDFLTLYAVTDAVVFVEVHQEGFDTQNLVISLNVFEKAIGRNNGTDTDIKSVEAEPKIEKSVVKLGSLRMVDDLLNVKTTDLMHKTTAKAVLEAVLPYVMQLWGKLSVKEYERILDDKHLALCFSRYYPKQLIISFGYPQDKLYFDLDRAWFNVEF